MRFHFNLVSPSERIPDDVGIEVSSPDQAYAQAIAAIQELRAEAESPADWDEWSLEVVDPTGIVVFLINLSDRLH